MNNMIAILQMMSQAADPMNALRQMAQNNPQMGRAMQMIEGKSPEQLKNMAQNMAKEQGIDLNGLMTLFARK